jgi:hypothetical protein
MVTMTGSSLAPIVIPIVAMVSLAAWLAVIFYADRHPLWGDRTKAAAKSIQSRQIRRRFSPRSVHLPHRAGTRQRVPVSAARRK